MGQVREYLVEERDGRRFTVQVPDDYELELRTASEQKTWGARLTLCKGTRYADWVSLKERKEGLVQFSDAEEKRKSTNCSSRSDAIAWAVDRLEARHTRRVEAGDPHGETGVARAGKTLLLGAIIKILLGYRLLLPPKVGDSQKKKILLACARMVDVFGPVKDVMSFSNQDIGYFYAVVSGRKPNGARLTPRELRALELDPERIGVFTKGKLKRVTVSTAHNNLCDFRSALSKIVGVTDESGRPLLAGNRFLQLELGSGAGGTTEAVSGERAFYILRYANAATELWNSRKRANEGKMRAGGVSSGRVLCQVPVGAVRCIFDIAWRRGARHEQILNLQCHDYLRSEAEVVRALRGCRQGEKQDRARPEWASLWSKYGCLFFAMEFSQKPGYDRVCPNDPVLQQELEHYMDLRQKQGLPNSGSLFRYLGHDRQLAAADVREIIRLAEELAREECVADGLDPEIVFMPGVRPMHDVRTAVMNRWAMMGWGLNRNAAYLGCLSTNLKSGTAADTEYEKLNGHLVFALAQGLTREAAGVQSGRVEEAKAELAPVASA
jgi:hypothetical protein